MKRLRKNWLVTSIGALVLAALALGALLGFIQTNNTAQAQTSGQTAAADRQAKAQAQLDNFTKNFAAKLNVDEATLNTAFSQAVNDTADQAVKDGQLTQALADLVKGQTKNGFKDLLAKPQFNARTTAAMSNMQDAVQYLMPIAEATAKSLNLSVFEVAAQLQADKSLADIAKAQNVDLQKVKDAITNTTKTQLDAVVKAGKATQAQADKSIQTLNLWLDDLVTFHKSLAPTRDSAAGLEGYFMPIADATAKVLNLTTDELKSQLQAGKTLGEIAKAQNVDLQKVKDTLLSSGKSALDAVVKDGKTTLTQAQADKLYQTATLWIDEVVK
jgi:hypothetical protein